MGWEVSGPVLVKVIWDDAWGEAEESFFYKDAHTKHHPVVMHTVGWLIIDDEKGVSIANERCLDDGEENYRGRTFIPKSLVRSVTPIVKTRAKRKVKPNMDEVAKPTHL